jgi:hypothetical protein
LFFTGSIVGCDSLFSLRLRKIHCQIV